MPTNQNSNAKHSVQSSFVPSLSPEHSIHDSSLPSDDSILLNGCQEALNGTSDSVCSTNSSTTHNKNDANYDDLNGMASFNKNMNDPNQTIETIASPHFEQTQFNCSQYMNEINCNTTYYEYDCNNNNNNNMPVSHQQMPMQQASPYYVYHTHYSDYSAPVNQPASNLSINTSMATTPQQSTQPFAANNGYFAGYSNLPYVYDPNLAYSSMMSPFSPNAPHSGSAILSSPQQQQQSTAMLAASYQTPPPPQSQLYISPSSMASPHSLSPNDATPNSTSTNSSQSTLANEHMSSSSCNSPHAFNGLIQQGQQLPPSSALTPNGSAQSSSAMYSNPYVLYPPQNPYLSPQAYQSPMPSSSSPYMMYPQQAAAAPHIQGQTLTPASVNSLAQALQSQQFSSGGSSSSRYTGKRSSRYNSNSNSNSNKRSFNNFNRFTHLEQTPPQFSNYPSQNMFNSPQKCCEDIQTVNADESTSLVEQSAQATSFASTASMCSPASTNYDYYDPNLFMGMNPLATCDYAQSGITTYGEENFDENYDDNSNLDSENGEQLACYVCRGRRMCFCYFLKVRYYKFPSFFDLVDHQYKKWRSSMIKAKKAQY